MVSANDLKPREAPVSFGLEAIDAALDGGLERAAMHEIGAGDPAHLATAAGFAAALVARAALGRPAVWVRQEFVDAEMGALHPAGLAELGLDPDRLLFVSARDAEGVLRAGEQSARCASLGAVVIEPWGEPKLLDFTASRRLSLAAAKSGVPVFLLSAALARRNSAAATRWKIRAALSQALEANAPGAPAFEATLLRRRGGAGGRTWRVEWNRDRGCFEDAGGDIAAAGAAPVSRDLVSVSCDGQAASGAPVERLRRTG